MNANDFKQNLDWIHKQIDETLFAKSEEYAGDQDRDRLRAFKLAATVQDITVKEALAGMMVKHTTSIYDMIGDGKGRSLSQWDEKIIDHINYLILLRAILVEEFEAKSHGIKLNVSSKKYIPADIQPEKEEDLKLPSKKVNSKDN